MNSKPYCDIVATDDMGYDTAINRYYVLFNVYITHLQKTFIVNCGCEDYNEMEDEMKNFTIEFLSYDLNNISMPYNKKLFEELESASKDVFGDLKFEKSTVVGV